jgi:hypothetical protein
MMTWDIVGAYRGPRASQGQRKRSADISARFVILHLCAIVAGSFYPLSRSESVSYGLDSVAAILLPSTAPSSTR